MRVGRSKWMISLKVGKIVLVISKFFCFEEGIFVSLFVYSSFNNF